MRYRSLGLATVLIVTSTAWAQTPSDNQHALIGPPQLHALPVTAPTLVEAYGPDPLQIGELRLPAGPGPFPVVMVIHGGCWTKGYETLAGTAPLASALTDMGVATWNIEYRQVGDTRGGWPGTFQDWGAALDHLRVLARTQPLDLKHVVTVGHSAGAHAALWLAARPRLPADSEVRGADPLKVSAAVAIDGPGDLRTLYGFDKEICGRPIFVNLFGGAPDAQAGRYRQANPIEWLPLAVPQFMVASVVLEPSAAQAYAAAAQSAGDKATVITLENAGDFNMLSPADPTWAPVEAAILAAAKAEQ